MLANSSSPWPPDYDQEYLRRSDIFLKAQAKPDLARAYYSRDPVAFINDWCFTVDPRNVGTDRPTFLPFRLFKRQEDLVLFFQQIINSQSAGLVEKSRDMGATWTTVAFSVWLWLFRPGAAIGFGSRKELLVDRLGDMDSIFEKIRYTIKMLPGFLLPNGFDLNKNCSYMKLLNPETNSSITGEAGDNIGRGGRKLIYFKDEAQPLDQPCSDALWLEGYRGFGDFVDCMRAGWFMAQCDSYKRRGKHDIYRVTLNDGTYADCSTNHLWAIENVIGKRYFETLSLSKIIENYRYVSPGGQVQYRYRLPATAPVRFASVEDYPLHPYIVGVLLGDGSINSGVVGLTSADDQIIQECARRLPAGCEITRDGESYNYRIVDVEKRTKSSRARNAVKASGIWGKVAHEKFIPEKYLFGSVSDRLELFHGLMDTDGSASGGTCTYHTSSKRLADDFRFLVQSLGGSASLNVKPDHRGYRDMYCLHITLPTDLDFFKLDRKNGQVNSRCRQWGQTIVDIKKIDRGEVRCITVDAEDGLYLTDNCIVTHNSAHYDHAEMIEAALMDNTNTQVDISSVNGTGNVFHRRRTSGDEWTGQIEDKKRTQVFIMDWRDHPGKDQEWYDARKQKAEADGLNAEFAREVDRSYTASILGTVIKAEWVEAAFGLAADFELDVSGKKRCGLDVGDDGVSGDKNAWCFVHGLQIEDFETWGLVDTGITAQRSYNYTIGTGCNEIQYDSIGCWIGVQGRLQYDAARK